MPAILLVAWLMVVSLILASVEIITEGIRFVKFILKLRLLWLVAKNRDFASNAAVVSCKVSVDEKGISKGFRFVQMESEEAALLAIRGLNGKDLKDEIKKLCKFSEFGKVNSAIVMKDSTGKSKGFGFVSFELPEHAKIAMEAMNGSKLGSGSKILYVRPAQNKAEREKILKLQFGKKLDQPLKKNQGETVYVKNLDISVDDINVLYYNNKVEFFTKTL
ncbi:polyadenylate-binding protein 2-like isoform X2 [Dioscorea cayenensis subsp. rotundata]|uniref:Polyadenylate-binding protein 2-like isoform X2 n=1 Tax=Dioscorea cayennensis subsp. rotundata TaxID=55577 RepID=A0AB40D0V5_DIOCR|nr:polyadenylate-binding protein 2-like isoform X2 [Dioscorea cayenensis subsp. rotundata]